MKAQVNWWWERGAERVQSQIIRAAGRSPTQPATHKRKKCGSVITVSVWVKRNAAFYHFVSPADEREHRRAAAAAETECCPNTAAVA